MINFSSIDGILFAEVENIEIHSFDSDVLYAKGKVEDNAPIIPIIFEERNLGEIKVNEVNEQVKQVAAHLAPLLVHLPRVEKIQNSFEVLKWIYAAKELAPGIVDWAGVYYKASYWLGDDGTDLILGPYIGEPTAHLRIPIDRGFCGMALREEKTVNVEDVTKDSTHIACSLKTRSELVIPIADKDGDFIAELDIDSNTLAAFTPELEKIFQEHVSKFPGL